MKDKPLLRFGRGHFTSAPYVFLHAVDSLRRDWLYFREHILVARMPRYRCYFLSGESIKAAENIEASDDAGALLEAEKLLLRSDFLAIEVWQERKFIGRHSIAPDIKVIVGGKSNSSKSDWVQLSGIPPLAIASARRSGVMASQ